MYAIIVLLASRLWSEEVVEGEVEEVACEREEHVSLSIHRTNDSSLRKSLEKKRALENATKGHVKPDMIMN